MILNILAYFLGIVCIVSSLLSLVKNEVWWIRIFDFPRLQILVVGILSVGIFFSLDELSFSEYTCLSLLALSILFQMIRIYPYTQLHKVQALKVEKSDEDNELGVYITNVFMDNRNSDKCLRAIEEANPDIILAVETNKWWQQALKGLEKQYPHYIRIPLENTYGMIMYSRFQLRNSEINYLLSEEIPSIKTEVELPSGKKLIFYGVHPKPPAPAEAKTTVSRDAELILIAKDAKKQKLPVVVAGDLNDVAWSHTTHLFQRLSGLLDPRVGRGMFPTFNSKYPLMRWPLDHLFHSKDFKIVNIRRIEHIGSDHFPIFVKLCLVPEEKHEQDAPLSSGSDHEEAKEKVEKAEK